MKLFLALNFFLAVFIILFILKRRGPKNFSSGKIEDLRLKPNFDPKKVVYTPRKSSLSPLNLGEKDFVEDSEPRDLNVLFNFNGHTWDAYEVLGLPAGSGWVRVDEAYKKAREKVDAQSHAFIDTAYSALKSKLKNSES